MTLDDFDDLQAARSRCVANIRPSGDTYLMEDFYYAGGLPALMNRIELHLDLDTLAVNGCTLGANIADAEVYNDDVIRPLSAPVYTEGALAVLRGNLAPNGVVLKPSACSATSAEPHAARHWCSTTTPPSRRPSTTTTSM